MRDNADRVAGDEARQRLASGEFRTVRVWGSGRALEQTVEVAIDEWTYDFGPHRFVQHLTFEQGKLQTALARG